MYKGNITTPTVLTTDSIIPFNTVWNTNANTVPVGNGEVELRTSGFYDVSIMATVTGVTVSPIAIQLFDGDEPIAETVAETDITATTGIHTLNITDTIRVIPNIVRTFARISARVGGDATISSANITIEKRK